MSGLLLFSFVELGHKIHHVNHWEPRPNRLQGQPTTPFSKRGEFSRLVRIPQPSRVIKHFTSSKHSHIELGSLSYSFHVSSGRAWQGMRDRRSQNQWGLVSCPAQLHSTPDSHTTESNASNYANYHYQELGQTFYERINPTEQQSSFTFVFFLFLFLYSCLNTRHSRTHKCFQISHMHHFCEPLGHCRTNRSWNNFSFSNTSSTSTINHTVVHWSVAPRPTVT